MGLKSSACSIMAIAGYWILKKIFNDWNVSEQDTEYKLLDLKEFNRVELRNYTLSWPNIGFEIKNEKGQIEKHPYEIGPDVLFQLSQQIDTNEIKLGNIIK